MQSFDSILQKTKKMCMAHGLKFPGIWIDFFLLAALKQMFKQIYVSFFELTECLVIFFLCFPFLAYD